MIKKITIFYVDNTFEDIDAEYFNKRGLYEDADSKTIKEIFIYYSNGKYTKVSNEVKIIGGGPGIASPAFGPFEPKYPVGPWVDPTKIVD